jgi:hypothetical protein
MLFPTFSFKNLAVFHLIIAKGGFPPAPYREKWLDPIDAD